METKRLFLLAGPAFVVLVVLIVAVAGETPGTTASGQELASFYGEHGIQQGAGSFLLAAAAPLLLMFGIGLATRFGARAEGGLTSWGYVLLSGTTLVAGSVLVTAFVHFALASGADEDVSPAALEALNSLDGSTWTLFNPAFGVMMLGAAGAVLSGASFRWLGWIALALGVAAFIPIADFFALLGTLVWILVASIALARSTAEPAYAAAAGTS